MKIIVSVLALALALGAVARAGPLDYDDPAMHFTAPAGWTRVDTSEAGGQNAPVAAFVHNRGLPTARSITIVVSDTDLSLDSFERSHESELRSSSDGTFIKSKRATTLSNGMPVYFVESSSTSASGEFVARFEYVYIDGKRGVTVTYIGNSTDVGEKDALAALSTLYAVAYPGPR